MAEKISQGGYVHEGNLSREKIPRGNVRGAIWRSPVKDIFPKSRCLRERREGASSGVQKAAAAGGRLRGTFTVIGYGAARGREVVKERTWRSLVGV